MFRSHRSQAVIRILVYGGAVAKKSGDGLCGNRSGLDA